MFEAGGPDRFHKDSDARDSDADDKDVWSEEEWDEDDSDEEWERGGRIGFHGCVNPRIVNQGMRHCSFLPAPRGQETAVKHIPGFTIPRFTHP